jgi:hypothetical protein|tara:strand:+ start:1081 stop:1485 length:405 start_codon:yes stop_codon:yes gene_type:complete
MVRLGITGTVTFENKIKIKNFIHKVKQNLTEDVQIVGLGDKNGADKYIRKYALELGCTYKEANLPHTSPTLYSMMTEGFYNKPYHVRNFFLRNQTFARYIDKLVVFDDSQGIDKKVANILKAASKAHKKTIVVN